MKGAWLKPVMLCWIVKFTFLFYISIILAARNIPITVDLETQAIRQLQFLKRVESQVYLWQSHLLKRAVYRYETFWMPLAASRQTENLAPPLDVQWMWQCHMLSPRAYIQDCKRVAGTIVSHTLNTPTEFNKGQEYTRMLWTSHQPIRRNAMI